MKPTSINLPTGMHTLTIDGSTFDFDPLDFQELVMERSVAAGIAETTPEELTYHVKQDFDSQRKFLRIVRDEILEITGKKVGVLIARQVWENIQPMIEETLTFFSRSPNTENTSDSATSNKTSESPSTPESSDTSTSLPDASTPPPATKTSSSSTPPSPTTSSDLSTSPLET